MSDCMYCDALDESRLALMTPVAALGVSTLHLYREQSHPGRCVLVLNEHKHKLTDLTDAEYAAFFADVRRAAKALTALYQPDKINYLVLGDLCPHLHLHLVPKYIGGKSWGTIFEMMPGEPKYLTPEQEAAEVARIRRALETV